VELLEVDMCLVMMNWLHLYHYKKINNYRRIFSDGYLSVGNCSLPTDVVVEFIDGSYPSIM